MRRRRPVISAGRGSCLSLALLLAALTARPTLAADEAEAAATQASEVVVVGLAPDVRTGPGLSTTGAGAYGLTAADIADLPAGSTSPMTDVLAQMPGVAIDQNQQIHIRDTEGPQFQYQINGSMVPLDINTNPPFLSMINPQFVRQIDLIDGILPARYGYATGGVVDIETKDGCQRGSGGGDSIAMIVGQREVLQPSAQAAGCAGRFGWYVSGLYTQGETAFSSATPGPNPIHDYTNQGQAFGYFSYDIDPRTRLSLTLSAAASDNQLPNVPNLAPQYTLAGAPPLNSANIDSYLNFRDYLAILALNGSNGEDLTWHLAYGAHYISQDFEPDNVGELIFQGVASTSSHYDIDNTLEGALAWKRGAHAIGAGVYAGSYVVTTNVSSLVFPVDAEGAQASATPIRVLTSDRTGNWLVGLWVDDTWQATPTLRANFGLRFDSLSGFTDHQQLDPTINLAWTPTGDFTLHGGFARYMQAPNFQGISPHAPAAYDGTTAAGPPGIATPLTEDDYEWDVGFVWRLGGHVTFSQDNFYEVTDHYLDTGQFGVVPIFAPFNYGYGYMWGSEFSLHYAGSHLSAYANLTLGQNWQKGVATGQFNFDPDELAYIDSHAILLDHQPLAGVSAGATWHSGPWQASADLIYSSGLVGGFADTEHLPAVVQVNAAVQRAFRIPRLGTLTNKVMVLNLFDRVNLIRPAEGIGIFQSAYGPRFTILDQISIAF